MQRDRRPASRSIVLHDVAGEFRGGLEAGKGEQRPEVPFRVRSEILLSQGLESCGAEGCFGLDRGLGAFDPAAGRGLRGAWSPVPAPGFP